MKPHVLAQGILAFAMALVIGALYSTLPAHAEETTGTNNLSYPVIWPKGEGSPVSAISETTFGEKEDVYSTAPEDLSDLEGDFTRLIVKADGSTVIDPCGTPCWYQGSLSANNVWQADYAEIDGDVAVGLIDWGDNLEAKNWPAGAPVRVEVVLYGVAPPATTYSGYEMLFIAFAMSANEMWGTTQNRTTNYPNGPTVYSNLACLTIQDVTNATSLTWDPDTSRWLDNLNPNTPADVQDFAAETNVKGMVIYGYNWTPSEPGTYRITFSFDGATRVSFGAADILTSAETTSATAAKGKGGKGGKTGGANAVVDQGKNITYIDVTIEPTKGGGSGRGGAGGGGGGGNGRGGPRAR